MSLLCPSKFWPARLTMILMFAALSGCSILSSPVELGPPPSLVTLDGGSEYPADFVPSPLRVTTSDILYVTDRNPVVSETGQVTGYGSARSKQMVYGVSRVAFGEIESWEALVAQSSGETEPNPTPLLLKGVREIARFPSTPLPYLENGGRLQTTPEAEASYNARIRTMRADLSARFRQTGLDRATIYIHGFANEFDDAVGTLANIWHYSGRQSLPIAYSWPAGNDGVLAYFRDSEAGEFSVFHLKEFLRVLASVPELTQIDIVAHSRGTAVATVALRELLLEARGAGKSGQALQRHLKTGTLVLAAADLDLGVAQQRLVAERFGNAFEQINIYVNPNDGALFLSGIIGAFDRVGGTDVDNLTDAEREEIALSGNVNVISVERGKRSLGHSYFKDNPAVLSDIILSLWTSAPAGSRARPLTQLSPNLYSLPPDYPRNVEDVIDVVSALADG